MSIEPTGLPAGVAAGGMANAPSWVRNGSAAVQKDYALGLQFEAMLARQLASSMTATAGLGEQQGSEEEGSSGAPGGASGASGPFSTMLSGAFAEGIGGGGLGLATEIARDLQSRTGTVGAAEPLASSVTGSAGTPVADGGTPAEDVDRSAATGGTSV